MPTPIASPVYTIDTWKGNVEDDSGVEWIVEGEEGWSSSPPIRTTLDDKAASDGAWSGPGFYSARVINLSGRARAADRVGMLAAKDRIKRAVQPRAAMTFVCEEAHLTRTCQVRLSEQVDLKDVTEQIFTWSLTLVAADPRRYNAVADVETATLPVSLTAGRTYPRTYPLVYGGGASGGGSVFIDQEGDYDQSPAQIAFYGPLITPRVEHVNSGRNLTFDMTLDYDDVLIVDLKTQTALLNGASNQAYTISPGSAWFMLEPGVNELALRGTAGSSPPDVLPAPVPHMTVTAFSAWT